MSLPLMREVAKIFDFCRRERNLFGGLPFRHFVTPPLTRGGECAGIHYKKGESQRRRSIRELPASKREFSPNSALKSRGMLAATAAFCLLLKKNSSF